MTRDQLRLLAWEQAMRNVLAGWRQCIADEDNDEFGQERASKLEDCIADLEQATKGLR